MKTSLLSQFISLRARGKKGLAVLLDPDRLNPAQLSQKVRSIQAAEADYVLWGGSFVSTPHARGMLKALKQALMMPVLLFPGHASQLDAQADGLLFLSLLSGRNPEYLIGQHVIAAPMLEQMPLEILPTGYLLIAGNVPTSVSYVSQTQPIPRNKPELVAYTALAGAYLGLAMIYLEAGSGATEPVPTEVISAVRDRITLPLWVGGGIRSADAAEAAYRAGADVVVMGTALESGLSASELEALAAMKRAFSP